MKIEQLARPEASVAELKTALRRLPAAVNVIAARTPDQQFVGITATAVTVLTFEPKTMIVCINRSSAFGKALPDIGHFSINTLTSGQREVADANAGGLPQDLREGVGDWYDGDLGVPLLGGAQASFLCRKEECRPYGTHFLVFGEVVGARSTERVSPLLYLDGAYGGFTRDIAGEAGE